MQCSIVPKMKLVYELTQYLRQKDTKCTLCKKYKYFFKSGSNVGVWQFGFSYENMEGGIDQ